MRQPDRLGQESCVHEPFDISVPQDQLDDLRGRLRATRWPDALPGSAWDYGTDLTYLQDVCEYWADGFDWRQAEARLKGWDHYRAFVDGEHVHYLHAPSPHPGACRCC
jgi:hypothetical protein